jgi:hypothetical protein
MKQEETAWRGRRREEKRREEKKRRKREEKKGKKGKKYGNFSKLENFRKIKDNL